jgi:hypothetical protein
LQGISDIRSTITNSYLHRLQGVQEYYQTEELVETVGATVTVLKGMILEVAHLETVEYCITDAIKESVNFEWIRLTGCSLHYQRLDLKMKL